MSTQDEKPKHTPSIIDQLSRTKTKEEIQNQKKAKAQGLDHVKSSEPTINEPAAPAPAPAAAAPTATVAVDPPRGRDQTASETTSSKPRHPDDERPSMSLAPKSSRVQERSVSPGQLPDGSHAKCSGERGEGYTPPTGLGKLGSKIRGIGHSN